MFFSNTEGREFRLNLQSYGRSVVVVGDRYNRPIDGGVDVDVDGGGLGLLMMTYD